MEQRFVDMVTGETGMYNTQTALLWNDNHLYIAFKVEEPFVEAHLTERDSILFLENNLEVFTDGGDCYYELQINALNTIYEVFFIWKDAYKKGGKFDIPMFDVHQEGAYTFGGDYELLFGKERIHGAFGGLLPILICLIYRMP